MPRINSITSIVFLSALAACKSPEEAKWAALCARMYNGVHETDREAACVSSFGKASHENPLSPKVEKRLKETERYGLENAVLFGLLSDTVRVFLPEGYDGDTSTVRAERPNGELLALLSKSDYRDGLLRVSAKTCTETISAQLQQAAEQPIREDEDDREYEKRLAPFRRIAASWKVVMVDQAERVPVGDLRVVSLLLLYGRYPTGRGYRAPEGVRSMKALSVDEFERLGLAEPLRLEWSLIPSKHAWGRDIEAYLEHLRTLSLTRSDGSKDPAKDWVDALAKGDVLADRRACLAKVLHRIAVTEAAERSDLEKANSDRLDAEKRAKRQEVLDRRFAPVVEQCLEDGAEAKSKCGELPGLEPSEREQCEARCVAAVNKRDAAAERKKREAAQAADQQAAASAASQAAAAAAAQKRVQERATCLSTCTSQGRDQATCARVCK